MQISYRTDDVLTAARKRISHVFDEFEDIVVSVSGGKDSTALRHLAVEEAIRRQRRVKLFFLDQEAEYKSTVDLIRSWMADPAVDPVWVQAPLQLTNATSHRQYWMYAWGPGEQWMREREPGAVPGFDEPHPERFYDFFQWFEQLPTRKTAFLIGLRSRESYNRFRSVTKNAGYAGCSWSTKTKSQRSFRFYPLYDWTSGDVWKLIADEKLAYNRHYDRMLIKWGATNNGAENNRRMRVSNLIHEKAFSCLAELQEFEPDTYERIIKRLKGTHCAALYAHDDGVFVARRLPAAFASWLQYREHLLSTTPIDRIDRFKTRFAKQPKDESTYRQQCKQLLLNDWENNVPVMSPKKAKLREIWWNRL